MAGDRYASCLYQRPSDGDVLACGYDKPEATGQGYALLRSPDDGVTWEVAGRFPPGRDGETVGTEATALQEITAPDGRPRLVAGLKAGIAVSDDGGDSWRRSDLWAPFRWYMTGFAQADAESPAARGTLSAAQALGDTLFAVGRDFTGGAPVVFASTDGERWSLRHRFPGSAFSALAIGPEGALWVGTYKSATEQHPTVIWRSGDGGRTWAPAQDGHSGQGAQSFATGRDGRLYVGSGDGVWRTNAIYATAEAPVPDPTAGLAVRVWPNPTGGPVAVSVKLAAPERVTVTVYDVQGREVLAVWDGAATDGQRFAVETAGLAPGAYVVRVASASGTATAGLTVVR